MKKGVNINPAVPERSAKFWKEYLEGCSPVLNFPYDYKGINPGNDHSDRERIIISPAVSSALRNIAMLGGISLSSTMLTVFGIMIHKYSGDDDLNIGTPVANRTHSSMEHTVGMFVNTIVIRFKFDLEVSFRSILRTTNEDISGAIAHQDLSSERIADVINPERIPNVNPLYQVLYVWQDNPDVQLNSGRISDMKMAEPDNAPVNMTLNMWDNGEVIQGEIEFNPALISRDTILRLRDNYINLVNTLVDNIEKPISLIGLITNDEKRRLLEYNDTSTPYPHEKTITQLFEEQVSIRSKKPALVSSQGSLTYAELNRKSNQLARILREKRVEKNKTVGLLTDKSIDFIVGVLGILKAGGVYLPLDPEYPQERINFMIEDSESQVILTQEKYFDLAGPGRTKICIDSADAYHQDESNIETDVSSDDLAYIMYTSGTTGKPKGSMITQKGVVRLVRNTNHIVITPEDKFLLASAIVFDAATFEIWGALLNGGSLYIPQKEEILDPDLLGGLLLKYQITTLWLTSALFTHIAAKRTDIFSSLKYLFVGGDVLSPPHINRVRRDNPRLTVINGYGPTENTTFTTCYKIDRNFEHNIPIGKPISNTTVYIFDKNLNLQPTGIIGELYVGGDGLSKGYINRDELNKISFIDHPYKAGEKLYRTGDFGRWLVDGNIEFHGRTDNQVKIRGFRVEIREVESVISGLEGVNDVVVKSVRMAEGDTRLVAFLDVGGSFRRDTREVISLLKERMPGYMVPSAIKIMHGFPLTINGKVDRKALENDSWETDESQAREDIELTPTEEKIYEIWCDVLKTKNIQPTDNFFEIGGNSLLAISVINRMEENLKVKIRFKDLRYNTTITGLAELVEKEQLITVSDSELVHLENLSNLPLTRSQKGIWLSYWAEPLNPKYLLSFTYRISGFLNTVVFERSIEVLLDRHHVLYSSVVEDNGEPYCAITGREIHLKYVDLRSGTPEDNRSTVFDFIQKDSRKAINLKSDSLYRMFLFILSEKEYYFYFAVHHIVFDGWSWRLFIEELNQIYNDLHGDKGISLKPLRYQQYDYAAWEQGLHKDESLLTDFWKYSLEDCSPVLNFPFDIPRKSTSSGHGDRERIRFSSQLSSALRTIANHEGVSLFSTMLTTFGILMHKYSGDDDLNIGTPVANRTHSSMEQTVGMFVNTIVIRFKFDSEVSFKSLIVNTSEVIFDAINHQDLPLEKIVETVNPERLPDINPVFQVVFGWEDNLNTSLKMNGLDCSKVFVPGGVAPFDLTCSLADNGEIIEGEIEYNIDLINRDTVIRLGDNYINLVNILVENFEKPISSIGLITDGEKKRVLEYSNTSTPYPDDKTITQLFEEQVSIRSKKTALVSNQGSLTYEELNCKSNQLARTLREMGVEKNKTVGLLTDKSINFLIGVLGILKAGGVYMPLDPEYPQERINFMVEDSGCQVIVTQQKYFELPLNVGTKICIDSAEAYHQDGNNVETGVSSDDLAYIMYTSGTTGTPKGSMITQTGVVRLVRDTNYIHLTPEDKILSTCAMVFDVATFEIWGALLNGGSLFIPQKEEILDPDLLGGLLLKYQITTLWLTSALLTHIAAKRTDIFGSLKYLLVGGDVLSPPHINRVRRDNPRLTVINGYGPTENTTFTTCYKIDRNFEHNIPIGKPISNTTVYIFDKNLNLQPTGIIGELYVGGDGLSKGYINRDELNKISFIDHPYKAGEKLYRTGDFGRWLADGNIEFHGRTDNQVKIRGFRVELREVESIISRIEGVNDVVVKSVRLDESDTRLVAFLDVGGSFRRDTREVISLLKERMPGYMVPSVVKLMNGFPLTINGKVDIKALQYDPGEINDTDFKEAIKLTPTEEKIYEIWSDVLKTKEILPIDNFFEIGGNSLLAISVINRINQDTDFPLNFKGFITNPTISQLDKYLETKIEKSVNPVQLEHLTSRVNLPLSINQKRIYLLTRLTPDQPSYIIPFTYELKGALNTDIFRKSINTLFDRHHVVFARIKEVSDEVFMDIVPERVNIEFIDYSNLGGIERDRKIIDFINAESFKIFDLNQGPLYRLHLINAGRDHFYFHISIHHIIFDGWSWGVFVKDLTTIYNSLLNGRGVNLEKLEFQQYDYAFWEKKNSLTQKSEESIAYWKENLKGAGLFLHFPFDSGRNQSVSGTGGIERFKLSSAISEKLKNISKSENSTLAAVMMSLFGILMHKYSGDTDICIGLPVTDRPHSKLENIFGMFVNTVVIRLKYERLSSFKDLIHLAFESMTNSISHQDLPFEDIVDLLKPERILNVNPIFQVCFAWQDNPDVPIKLDGISGKRISGTKGAVPFDLTLNMWDNGEETEGEIEFITGLLTRDTIIRLRDNYINLVNTLVDNIEKPISTIGLITDNEKELVLEYNNTSTPYPHEKTITQLFEEQVSIRSKKTALLSSQGSLTYVELNRKSNQLARTLRERGVEKNKTVGLLADKSIDFIVGVLGILKAGGVYMPLDPEYPPERINFMIEDSDSQVILTQEKYFDLAGPGRTKICIDTYVAYHHDESNIEMDVSSDDLAYIMYTSGTTGKPKGSMITQKGVVRLVCNTNHIVITPEDRFLLASAIVFDAATFQIWGALLNGGSLYIPDKEELLDPGLFEVILKKNQITILCITSALFTHFASIRTDIFSCLKYLTVGGDVLSPPHVNKVKKDNPQLRIINVYGPTENTGRSTYYEIDRECDKNIPIGKPISNSTAYIFDKYLNLQPTGIIGELYVGGDGLSKGYLNRDELNKTSFIDHPYIPGEKLYRTGDYCRWLSDGNIEFHGRTDNQVKIRGFRVEIREVESVISGLEGVNDVVVKSVRMAEGDTRLVAFLDVVGSFRMDKREVTSLLKERMPGYMVPSAIKIMHGFPLTINGKVDRKALENDSWETDESQAREDIELTPTEEKMYEIWCDVLKTKNILPTDNFFETGGNSLTAISVISKIESKFRLRLGLKIFFDKPRIRDLSEFVDFSTANPVIPDSGEKKEGLRSKIIRGSI